MSRHYCLLLLGLFLPAATIAQTASPATAKPEAPLSIESFAAPPFLEDPELSPNGTWFAGRMARP